MRAQPPLVRTIQVQTIRSRLRSSRRPRPQMTAAVPHSPLHRRLFRLDDRVQHGACSAGRDQPDQEQAEQKHQCRVHGVTRPLGEDAGP